MTLLIDAGNTLIKWAWQPDASSTSVAAWTVHGVDHASWRAGTPQAQALHAAWQAAQQVYVCNVAGNDWLQYAQAAASPCQQIQASAQALGVINGYERPAQLGSDRWCSALAVWQHYAQPALVVTAGTAMTLDVLLREGAGAVFAGGSIQPGLRLMWQSMQHGAAQLHYDVPSSDEAPPGERAQTFARNSQQAMWQGCVQALAASVAAQFERVCAVSAQPPLLILSGGDAALIMRYLPAPLAAQAIIVDNLVLKGMAALASHSNQ